MTIPNTRNRRRPGPTGRSSAGFGVRRGGFILIAVLIVVMLASMVVMSLLFRLRAEETAAAAGAGAEQAWAVAMSGVNEAMRVASQTPAGMFDWLDNPTAFHERLVLDDGADRWFFTVYSEPSDPQETDVRFGLTDEASKLNINTATEEMLEKLPKMTPYLAQGLLDFLDPDDTPRPEGAEQEYYDTLPTPYAILNGPLRSLDDLLLVRGFTPALLYGEDANWNYRLEPNEDDGDAQFPPDNKDGKLDPGLRPFLTVLSSDPNQDNQGRPRINLNDANQPLATNDQGTADPLPEAIVTYIEALRRTKVQVLQPADLLEAKSSLQDESGKTVPLDSGVGKAELAMILDRFTTRTDSKTAGLIDVNTASSRVLQTVPGVDEALADSIVSARRDLRPEQRRTSAWLYTEGVMDATQFKKISPYLTARGFQFHFEVVGYAVPSGRYRVLEAVIDVTGAKPSISYLRDITKLGLPFPINTTNEQAPTAPDATPEQVRAGTLSKAFPHG